MTQDIVIQNSTIKILHSKNLIHKFSPKNLESEITCISIIYSYSLFVRWINSIILLVWQYFDNYNNHEDAPWRNYLWNHSAKVWWWILWTHADSSEWYLKYYYCLFEYRLQCVSGDNGNLEPYTFWRIKWDERSWLFHPSFY